MAKLVLISGPCGAGKTTLLGLGYRRLSARFGRVATLDTDWPLTFVDPLWELPYEERDGDLAFRQLAMLIESFLGARFDTVLVAGNALHTEAEFCSLIAAAAPPHEVFHVTLDPSLEAVIARVVERGGDKTPEWLDVHVQWMRERPVGVSARIDNTNLTPIETIEAIAERLERGEGRRG